MTDKGYAAIKLSGNGILDPVRHKDILWCMCKVIAGLKLQKYHKLRNVSCLEL